MMMILLIFIFIKFIFFVPVVKGGTFTIGMSQNIIFANFSELEFDWFGDSMKPQVDDAFETPTLLFPPLPTIL